MDARVKEDTGQRWCPPPPAPPPPPPPPPLRLLPFSDSQQLRRAQIQTLSWYKQYGDRAGLQLISPHPIKF
eukprot:1049419-Rhodomonas_salina.1